MNTVLVSNELAKQMCKSGYRYLYGGKDQPYTKALVEKLAKAYPRNYSASLKAEAMKDADKGYKAIDCSGFVCKVLGVSGMGSAQIRSSAVKRLPVTKANAKEGMAIWKSGHIAYIGEGLKIYEAQSTKNDMKVTDFSKRASAFSELLVVKGSYLANNKNESAKGRNPFKEPTKLLKIGSKGDEVKWIQYELVEAGYNIVIDGDFGTKTQSAVRKFQQSCKIEVDGKVWTQTIKAMKNN